MNTNSQGQRPLTHREEEFLQGQQRRARTFEEEQIGHILDEARIIWIDRQAKNLPWIREGIKYRHQRTGPIAKTSRTSKLRVVAYAELKLDTPRDGETFLRRYWYLMPHDHKKPSQTPGEAVVTSSIIKGQESRVFVREEPP